MRVRIAFFTLITATMMVSNVSAQNDRATLEANKKLVADFYDAALVKKDVDAATKYLGNKYIQHNPSAPDGIDGVRGLIAFLTSKYPQRVSLIKRVMAEGDLVMLHVHAINTPGERGNAIVDIFRVENGRIVEHWDVIQAVPEKAANDNTMF